MYLAGGVFSVGDESRAVIVLLSTPVPAAKLIGRPDHGNAIDLPGMPVIDLTQLSCACSNTGSCGVFSRNNKVDIERPI